MDFLLHEDDFNELPAEPDHKWLALEKVVRSRLLERLASAPSSEREQLILNYMDLIVNLAGTFAVSGIDLPTGASVTDIYNKFLRIVSVTQSRIWAASAATFPFGRVAISVATKSTILSLVNQIEMQIDSWEVSEPRKLALHKCIANFRREINEQKSRVGYALSEIAKVAAVAAISVSVLADVPDAFSTIQKLLGAEQLAISNPEVRLVETETRLLLPPPVKQIEDQSSRPEP